MKEYLFVEIDMRNDFSNDPRAALPVPGTLELVGKMRQLEEMSDGVLIVMDHHEKDDPVSLEEFKTFPPHCIPGTWGHERIYGLYEPMIQNHQHKNTYNYWKGLLDTEGKEHTLTTDMIMDAKTILVGGVVTGICVKAFIDGCIERGIQGKVVVVSDCVANLNVPDVLDTDDLFKEWIKVGLRIMDYDECVKEFIL